MCKKPLIILLLLGLVFVCAFAYPVVSGPAERGEYSGLQGTQAFLAFEDTLSAQAAPVSYAPAARQQQTTFVRAAAPIFIICALLAFCYTAVKGKSLKARMMMGLFLKGFFSTVYATFPLRQHAPPASSVI